MTAELVAIGLATAFLVVGPLGGPASAGGPRDEADGVEVVAGDVNEIVVSTLRTPDASTDPDEPLFTVSGILLESSPGDPVTWGEWSSASAVSKVTVVDNPHRATTRVHLRLSGLVPNGLYSAFWGTLGPDSEQPLCPRVERTLPLDAVGGGARPAPNAFVAGADGTATFHGAVDQNLFAATQVFFQVVWHFSGETHYPFPNVGEFLTQVPPNEQCRSSFGHDAMRHIQILQKW